MAAEFVVYEVSTTQHYGPAGDLLFQPGDRVVADASRPLPDGWRYEVDRVERAEPVKVDKDETKDEPPAKRGRGAS